MDLIKEEVELDAEQPVKVRDWLNELSQRLDLVRDAARMTGLYERDVWKEAYDCGTTTRKFKAGDMVLLRTPGMHGKREEA